MNIEKKKKKSFQVAGVLALGARLPDGSQFSALSSLHEQVNAWKEKLSR